MNPFIECSKVEREGLNRLLPMIQQKAHKGRFVLTSKGRLAPILQKTIGDMVMNTNDEYFQSVEIKTERDHTGNLFLETWSNRHWNTDGWMRTLDADFLWYYFLDTDDLYVMRFAEELKPWFSENERRFREVKQRKTQQMNDTWGRLVSVTVLSKEMLFWRHIHPVRDFGPQPLARYVQMDLFT